MRACLAIAALLTASYAVANVEFTKVHPPVVVTQPGATAQERLAARELAEWLGKILGTTVVTKESSALLANAIVVGQGPLAKQLAPTLDWTKLGDEDVILKTAGKSLLVAGGRPRGTIYAVNRLLHREGVRWWAPWATTAPHKPSLKWANLDVHETPTFEARDPFWFHAFDRGWARRNNSNSAHARLTEEDGGAITYEGFVHTYYPLVPPDKHFAKHPEWYSLISGKRTSENAQLCTTNPQLRDFVVEQVRERLRKNPNVRIVSVSQNDCYNPCQCDTCKALYAAEGSESAGVLSLANYVAEKIEREFPKVAIDTLAYQYSRKAPKTMRPRPNVIVRLCSIECGFSQPLTASSNATFARDIRDWSRLTNRLYVWNYVTDFPNYMQPFPNWYVIGPNERFFAENGVKGLFEQGAYQSYGSSMAEMHAWVQSQLLWNPHQDDRALIREFLAGYYGAAAKPIGQYMDRLAAEAAKYPMSIWVGPEAPFFNLTTVLECEQLWNRAEAAVAKQPEQLWRVRIGHLAIRYVILSRWNQLRAEAARTGVKWPLPNSRKSVADDWIRLASAPGPAGWSPVRFMNESGLPPERWIERFAVDPDPPTALNRVSTSALPKDMAVPQGAEVVSVQESEARLYGEGDLCETRTDLSASDHVAVRMPGTHHEWSFQISASKMPGKVLSGRWKVYLVVRVEPSSDASKIAFTAGVYDESSARGLGGVAPTCAEAGLTYRSYLLTTTALNEKCYVWAAPADQGSKAVWVDRVVLVKEK